MSISIITRSYRTSELRDLISYLNRNNEIEKEVIAVCNVKDYDFQEVNLILEDSNMFEARIRGIKNAQFDRVLLLDSDQIPEDGLLRELNNRSEDIVIVPERSLSSGFTAKCLDDWRMRMFELGKRRTSPYIPAVPRFYKREPLMTVIKTLSDDLYKIVSHEDSILFYQVFKATQNIGFSTKYIYNRDPDFITLMRKAFKYGKFKKFAEISSSRSDILHLLNELNRSFLNIKELRLGKGYLVQIPRGFAYMLGEIL